MTAASKYHPTDRRPIASRKLRIWQRAASELARRGVSANVVSCIGLVFGIASGVSFAGTAALPDWDRLLWFIAAVCIQLRLLANMLDGMVAIESGRASPLGELFNEVPDRFSDAATLIGLGYAAGGSPALGFVAAILAVLTAYVRAVVKVAGAPQDYRGPMAKQQRMFIATGVGLFAAVTPIAWHPGADGSSWGVAAWALLLISAGCIVTIVRRLSRAASILGAAAP